MSCLSLSIGRLEEQARQFTQDRDSDRQDIHYLLEQVHGLSDSVSKLTNTLTYSLDGVLPGPEQVDEVHAALRTSEDRQRSVKEFGTPPRVGTKLQHMTNMQQICHLTGQQSPGR